FVGQVWSRKFDQGMANAPNNRAGENLVCRRSRLLLTCYPTLRKDRTERHSYNRADEQLVRQKWGEKAVVEWLFHIAIDNLDTAFKKAKTTYGRGNAFNFFRFGIASDNFIYIDAETLDDDNLRDEFDDVYDER
ncbi:MAG: hypothetical protein NTX79_02935, partial [Candidatus Micrarchaeota archaeon]|nr:hypothetical protein [Candidatus Micrarchaeota archaeon]